MTVFQETTSGYRWRARALGGGGSFAPEQLQQDDGGDPYVHWWTPQPDDPFMDGARAGLFWSLTTVFGGFIGQVLNDATLDTVQRWNGSAWEDVA